uniref:Uncharacterized protein n=1 Tax=Ascaris lumbricoides TaxID=6252 RepID=A0A0M3HVQ8_ASCLU
MEAENDDCLALRIYVVRVCRLSPLTSESTMGDWVDVSSARSLSIVSASVALWYMRRKQPAGSTRGMQH